MLFSFKYPTLGYAYEILKSKNIPPINNKSHELLDVLIIQKSLLQFKIYYESLDYEESTEYPQISLIDCILNLGYTFGLFLGKCFFFA
jgi:hypothetical protein